ncbi:hypothetical protein ABIF54_008521 [Bradyrhizobium japonicum]
MTGTPARSALVVNAGEGVAKTHHQSVVGLGKQRVPAAGADADPARAELGGAVDRGHIRRNRKIDHVLRRACEIDVAAGEVERQERQAMPLDQRANSPRARGVLYPGIEVRRRRHQLDGAIARSGEPLDGVLRDAVPREAESVGAEHRKRHGAAR